MAEAGLFLNKINVNEKWEKGREKFIKRHEVNNHKLIVINSIL